MKLKLFRQLEAMDCGPACIQMISFYYGRSVSLYKLRDYCNVTRIGISGTDIVNGCRAIGLNANIYRFGIDVINQCDQPLILFWRQNHFVVLHKILKSAKGNIYIIADPEYGIVKLAEDVFKQEWLGNELEGVAITTEPTADFFKMESDSKPFNVAISRLFELLFGAVSRYKKSVIRIIMFSILVAGTNWLIPFFFQRAVDIGITSKNMGIVLTMMLGQLFFFVGYSLAGGVNSIILAKVGFKISIEDLLKKFLFKLIRLPISFFDTKLNTDLLLRMDDQRKIQNLLTNNIQRVALSVINFFVFSVILCHYNVFAFFIFLSLTIVSFTYTRYILRKLKALNYSKFTIESQNKSISYELITNMPEIKVNHAQVARITIWEKLQNKINHLSLKTITTSLRLSIGTSFITHFAEILILIVSAYLVVQGQITIGVMMTITYIIGQLSNATSSILSFLREMQEAKLSFNRLEEVYRRDDENNRRGIVLTKVENGFTFSNVSFKYEGSFNPYVLHDINLSIPTGKVTAIVGASGSGKTTLMKLLLAFYYPQRGEIKLDDSLMSEINSDEWRSQCGAVLQDGHIFNGSVAENIALAEIEPNMENVKNSAKIACIHEFIDGLPLKYNTKIGNSGLELSGGQKQRILIARAVYKNPDFIFFDEATSSLDAKNEKEIMDNLSEFYAGKTVIIIAHRLSTVRNADKIIFLDCGRVIEEGTHIELTAIKGAYYKLVKNQLEIGK